MSYPRGLMPTNVKLRGQIRSDRLSPSSSSPFPYLVLQEARKQILDLSEGLGAAALGLRAEGDGALARALPVLGGDEVAVLLLAELVEDGAHQVARVPAVALHVAHHHGHVDVLGRVPAVVVGRHADHLEGHLGLARQLRLGQQ